MSSGEADGLRLVAPERPHEATESGPEGPGGPEDRPPSQRWTPWLIRGVYDTLAITGVPGSGKTTLAQALGSRFGWPILATGDLARAVDPGSRETGAMADESLLGEAFARAYAGLPPGSPVILDGIPRTEDQLAYLPLQHTRIIFLTVRPDIALTRLLSRGRHDDDPEMALARLAEQSRLLQVDIRGGWAYRAAGWHTTVSTTYKTARQVADGVVEYILGHRTEAF